MKPQNSISAKHRFFVPKEQISGTSVVFSEEEASHAVRVLRLNVGDQVIVVDGQGKTHLVELETMGKKSVIGAIRESWSDLGEPAFQLHVGLALLKQSARWESFLEKAVESGCSRITPFLSNRTQTKKFNTRRAEAIMVSALKQCERSRLPVLDAPSRLSEMLQQTADLKLICHESLTENEGGAKRRRLAAEIHAVGADIGSISVFVGPEGGFSEEEMAAASAAGWLPIWLGDRRLRAETAALTAVTVISQLMDELGSSKSG